MIKTKTEIELQISAVISNFLQSQLGEKASSVKTLLAGNTLAVGASDCLTPAESKLTQDEKDWMLLQNFKAQQFDYARPVLEQYLEELTGCKVVSIVTTVGKDGMRFEMVIFNEDVEEKFNNQHGE